MGLRADSARPQRVSGSARTDSQRAESARNPIASHVNFGDDSALSTFTRTQWTAALRRQGISFRRYLQVPRRKLCQMRRSETLAYIGLVLKFCKPGMAGESSERTWGCRAPLRYSRWWRHPWFAPSPPTNIV